MRMNIIVTTAIAFQLCSTMGALADNVPINSALGDRTLIAGSNDLGDFGDYLFTGVRIAGIPGLFEQNFYTPDERGTVSQGYGRLEEIMQFHCERNNLQIGDAIEIEIHAFTEDGPLGEQVSQNFYMDNCGAFWRVGEIPYTRILDSSATNYTLTP